MLSNDGVTYCFLFTDENVPRDARKQFLGTFCFVARGVLDNPVVVGAETEKRLMLHCSYDFCLLDMPDWTEGDAAKVKESNSEQASLRTQTRRAHSEYEYPSSRS